MLGLLGRHKTKCLHRLTFALRLGVFRLHQLNVGFTHEELHVYACGLFYLCVGKSFVYGHLCACEAYLGVVLLWRWKGV